MPLPLEIVRLIEQSRVVALADVGVAFSRAVARVVAREIANDGRSSASQLQKALDCVMEAQRRLADYTGAVRRILAAARFNPTPQDRVELQDSFGSLMEELIALVSRQADIITGNSTFDRNHMSRHLSGRLGEARRSAVQEFEIMLLESANAAHGPAAPVVYVFTGNNARVNNQSVDVSTNTVVVTEIELFANLRQVLEIYVRDDHARRVIIDAAEALRSARDRADRMAAYARFMGVAAPHLSVVQPLIGALSEWAGS